MEYIRVTKENLEKEHICCAISNNKDIQVSSKKAWLADRFDEGLVFLKSVERGKCFIEYIPAECAWNPIEAPGYMYINCLWVSGSFKGHGCSSELLSACIEDSKEKGKEGLCILAAARKKPFLADPKFLKYKGFEACDEADNGIQLWYLPFEEKTEPPVFKECAKHPHINERGYVLYYTNQCPFNAKYVPILEETAQKNGIPFKAVKIESRKDAQNVPTPITTYALFCDGEYVTNEQMNDKKFLKLVGREEKTTWHRTRRLNRSPTWRTISPNGIPTSAARRSWSSTPASRASRSCVPTATRSGRISSASWTVSSRRPAT